MWYVFQVFFCFLGSGVVAVAVARTKLGRSAAAEAVALLPSATRLEAATLPPAGLHADVAVRRIMALSSLLGVQDGVGCVRQYGSGFRKCFGAETKRFPNAISPNVIFTTKKCNFHA